MLHMSHDAWVEEEKQDIPMAHMSAEEVWLPTPPDTATSSLATAIMLAASFTCAVDTNVPALPLANTLAESIAKPLQQTIALA